jgi:hypothetical protein
MSKFRTPPILRFNTGHGWYIYRGIISNGETQYQYLLKTGIWSSFCGDGGHWKSRPEAKKFLDSLQKV